MTAKDDGALRDLLLRFLLRERAAGRAGLDETHGLPLVMRVEAGDAIAPVTPLGWEPGGRLRLHAPIDNSRFGPGDTLKLGPGDDPVAAPAVRFVGDDPERQEVLVEVPAWGGDRGAIEAQLAAGRPLALDRAGIDLSERLVQLVERAFGGPGPREAAVRGLLAGRVVPVADPGAREAARSSLARLEARGIALCESQQEAFAAAWAARPFHLVQGPPGTGKTFLLALLVAALAYRGERILVTAQNNLAVDNALLAIADVTLRAGRALPMQRVAGKDGAGARLDGRGIEIVRARDVRPPGREGLVVGATLYGAGAFADAEPFDRVVFDEAAQVPLAHAVGPLLAGRRWLFFGDDCQLGPVIVAEGQDPRAATSIFTHLRPVAAPTLLDRTFRLNEALCAFPSAAFYGGRLHPAPSAAARRFAPPPHDPALAAVLAPDPAALLVRLDHEGYHQHCPPEVEAVVEVAAALLAPGGLPPDELAIIAPFRVQNREIARALRRRLGRGATLPAIDTVERIQGQEREVVLVSLACSDPDALRRNTAFFFSPNRLCVTLTRARTKLVVFGSPHLLRTFPPDHAGLVRLDVFHRLFAELPHVRWPERSERPASD